MFIILILKNQTPSVSKIDPHLILEGDCLRWLIKMGRIHKNLVSIAIDNLTEESFLVPSARELFKAYMDAHKAEESTDRLSLNIRLESVAAKELLAQIDQKKINLDRAEEHFIDSVQKLLERNWMEKREEIRAQLISGICSDEEAFALIREFEKVKNQRPKVLVPQV